MAEERKTEGLLKRILWKASKAALAGFFTLLLVYFLPTLLFPVNVLPEEYMPLFQLFVIISVSFAVVIELFSGTIIQHMLGIAKALILITFFFYAFDGGVVTADIEMTRVIIDLRVFLAILILVNLLGLAKNVLGAISFLSEKTENSKLCIQE